MLCVRRIHIIQGDIHDINKVKRNKNAHSN